MRDYFRLILGFLGFILAAEYQSLSYAFDLEKNSLPVIEPMPGMRTEWAAERMIYNGAPMSIRNFASSRTEEEVLQFYSSKWKSVSLASVTTNRVGDEWVIGYGKDDFYYTVQVRNEGKGSVGSLVVTYLKQKKHEDTKFPMLPGGKVISRIENIDNGIHAETLTVGSRQSQEGVIQWYDAQLRRMGWVRLDREGDPGGKFLVKEYQKQAEKCQLRSIHAGDFDGYRTLLHITWIKG